MIEYSKPELATERRICGRIRAKVLRDPCSFCRNRVSGWGASTCNTPGRNFPLCTKRGSPAFDPDFELIDETMRKLQ